MKTEEERKYRTVAMKKVRDRNWGVERNKQLKVLHETPAGLRREQDRPNTPIGGVARCYLV